MTSLGTGFSTQERVLADAVTELDRFIASPLQTAAPPPSRTQSATPVDAAFETLNNWAGELLVRSSQASFQYNLSYATEHAGQSDPNSPWPALIDQWWEVQRSLQSLADVPDADATISLLVQVPFLLQLQEEAERQLSSLAPTWKSDSGPEDPESWLASVHILIEDAWTNASPKARAFMPQFAENMLHLSSQAELEYQEIRGHVAPGAAYDEHALWPVQLNRWHQFGLEARRLQHAADADQFVLLLTQLPELLSVQQRAEQQIEKLKPGWLLSAAHAGRVTLHAAAHAGVFGVARGIAIGAQIVEENLPVEPGLGTVRAEDRPLYRVTQSAEQAFVEALPPEPMLQQSVLWTEFPQALGSMLGLMALAAVTRKLYFRRAALAPLVLARAQQSAASAMTTTAGLLNSGAQFFQEARLYGAQDKVAQNAFLCALPLGALEAAPIMRMFKTWTHIDPTSARWVQEYLAEGSLTTLGSSISQLAQTDAGNLIAKSLYDENREYFENALHSGGMGLSTSGVLHAAMGLAFGRRALVHQLSLRYPDELHPTRRARVVALETMGIPGPPPLDEGPDQVAHPVVYRRTGTGTLVPVFENEAAIADTLRVVAQGDGDDSDPKRLRRGAGGRPPEGLGDGSPDPSAPHQALPLPTARQSQDRRLIAVGRSADRLLKNAQRLIKTFSSDLNRIATTRDPATRAMLINRLQQEVEAICRRFNSLVQFERGATMFSDLAPRIGTVAGIEEAETRHFYVTRLVEQLPLIRTEIQDVLGLVFGKADAERIARQILREEQFDTFANRLSEIPADATREQRDETVDEIVQQLMNIETKIVDRLASGTPAIRRGKSTSPEVDDKGLAHIGSDLGALFHDFRNRFHRLLTGSDDLRMAFTPEARRDIVNRIMEQSVAPTVTLARRAEDTLHGKRLIERRNVKTEEYFHGIIRKLHQQFAHLKVTFEVKFRYNGFSPDEALFIDDVQIKRVLENLGTNAAEAIAFGGHVVFEVSADDGYYVIAVRDNGPGISPSTQERLFEPYFTTKAGGSGFGLPKAKEIVEAQGGTLTFRTRPEVDGTEFVIRLPRQRREQPLIDVPSKSKTREIDFPIGLKPDDATRARIAREIVHAIWGLGTREAQRLKTSLKAKWHEASGLSSSTIDDDINAAIPLVEAEKGTSSAMAGWSPPEFYGGEVSMKIRRQKAFEIVSEPDGNRRRLMTTEWTRTSGLPREEIRADIEVARQKLAKRR